MEPAEIIAYGEKIDVLTRRKHPLGDVVSLEGETAVLQSYFRNNVLHLFSAAAWIALCFQNNRRLSRAGMLRLGRTIYPFIQEELFLPWSEDEFAERLNATIDLFIAEGLLHAVNDEDGGILSRGPGQTDEVFRLRAIAHSLQQAFERYFIAITTLVKNGPRTLSAGELETLCHLAAQRLSLLYAPAAPEFFDKSLFRGFIGKLRELKLVWVCPNGKLDFDERLNTWEKDAKLVLSARTAPHHHQDLAGSRQQGCCRTSCVSFVGARRGRAPCLAGKNETRPRCFKQRELRSAVLATKSRSKALAGERQHFAPGRLGACI